MIHQEKFTIPAHCIKFIVTRVIHSLEFVNTYGEPDHVDADSIQMDISEQYDAYCKYQYDPANEIAHERGYDYDLVKMDLLEELYNVVRRNIQCHPEIAYIDERLDR